MQMRHWADTTGDAGRWITRPTPPPGAFERLFGFGPVEAAVLAPIAVVADFAPGQVLQKATESVTDCLFVHRGMATTTCARHGTEGDIVSGPDIVNGSAILGVPGTGHAVVAVTSVGAYRVEVAKLAAAMEANPALRVAVMTMIGASIERLRRRAACHLVHGPEQRLAAWILRHHGTGQGPLKVTHAYLARLLGVRRPTVTVSLHALEGVRAITAKRSCIAVRDAARLRERACTCHGPF